MAEKVSRRDILKGTAGAAAAMVAGSALASGAPSLALADPIRKSAQGDKRQVRFGIIGAGGKGWSGMEQAAEHGPIVALADVDMNNRTKAMAEHPRAASFCDYREMLEAMHGELDAVVISIPDHHHAPATAMALRLGLNCYTEKPLTRTIWEARQLATLARDHHRATQMGNQSTASTPMRKVAALIKRGDFGHAKEVHLWTDRASGWWAQGVPRPQPGTCPATLDWPTWLGPRPERPYADGYHPFAWRGWWDFGTGSLGDMGCHIFNMPYMALDLRDPLTVQAQTSGHNRDSFPNWSIVTYEFGAHNGRAPVTLKWYDGGKKPDASLAPGFEYGGNGVLVVCEKDTVYGPSSDNVEFHLVSGGPFAEVAVEESPGHMAEFARACLGGQHAVSNFPEYSGPLTETVLLGNLAIWADGPKLQWDARRMKVRGTSEFDSLIKPEFREGWTV